MPSVPWLNLVLAPGLGPAGAQRLLEHFDSIDAIVSARRQDLMAAGIDRQIATAILKPDPQKLGRAEAWLSRRQHHIISCRDERYPVFLREIPQSPPVLFVSGDPDTLSLPQIAIVGSRNPTAGGCDTARQFAAHLARAGFAITSGLAVGIDTAAHLGALEAGGLTIAVCGTGLDYVYPPQNEGLADSISTQGALVSEFPPGTESLRSNFPRRNRLISGLTVGTLVVEAGIRSGALITARLAGEQGREVFAIPGSIHSPLSKGCHQLIRQGAKLVETARDIVEELGGLIDAAVDAYPTAAAADTKDKSEDPEYRRLLTAMGWDPVSVDVLVERSGLTADEVSSMLLILELDGRAETLPGGHHRRREGRPK
jgi:DNA processing protein